MDGLAVGLGIRRCASGSPWPPASRWSTGPCQPGGVVDEVHGAAETSRRTRTLVGVVLVLLLLGAAGDRWQADRERRALLETVAAGEQVVQASGASLRGLATYVGPLTSNPDAPERARAWAYDTLAHDAARWQPRVQSRRQEVLDVPVAPWHGDVRAAREAYAERLGVWVDVLVDLSAATPGQTDRGQAVRASKQQAREALLLAGADVERVRELLGRGEARSASPR